MSKSTPTLSIDALALRVVRLEADNQILRDQVEELTRRLSDEVSCRQLLQQVCSTQGLKLRMMGEMVETLKLATDEVMS